MPIIRLPKENLIFMDNNEIEINVPDSVLARNDYSGIRDSAGILKKRKIDPVAFQKEIRKEWE
ncbi:MAG: hypothetical protein A2Y33_10650 [Spirochaetes bacterium GWF1_51_8]|nr:MAG: hypothetical protein A2Y33_10650 [Spirochaetes bacterium GWF1_51_8]